MYSTTLIEIYFTTKNPRGLIGICMCDVSVDPDTYLDLDVDVKYLWM